MLSVGRRQENPASRKSSLPVLPGVWYTENKSLEEELLFMPSHNPFRFAVPGAASTARGTVLPFLL